MTADRSEPRLLSLAGVALSHAIGNRTERASKAVQMIGDEYGGDGVVRAAMAWIDSLIADSGRAHAPDRGQPARLQFFNADTGAVGSAADVDPETAWCGQLIAARYADDEVMFEALVASLPSDDLFRRRMLSLLSYVAQHYQLVLAMKAARVAQHDGPEGRGER